MTALRRAGLLLQRRATLARASHRSDSARCAQGASSIAAACDAALRAPAATSAAMRWTDAGVPWRAGWGTRDNPVPIASSGDSRVVACAGGPSRAPHDLQWIVVRKGSHSACPECEQVFALTRAER